MSKRFKDIEGREYKIKITIPRLRMVRDELDIDLGKQDAFIAISNNPIDFVNVLYLLVRDQVDRYGLSDVQFGESFDGELLESAWDAFCKAYLSFCPSHRAKILRRLMASAAKAEMLSAVEVENMLAKLTASYKQDSHTAPSLESNRETIPLEN